MKKLGKLVGWSVLIFFMLSAASLWAQTTGKSVAAAPILKQLPDLVIEKIYLTKNCTVSVVVKNLGPGYVPNSVWTVHTPKSAGVFLYRNGTGWGGGSIWKFDPAKALQKPGGTATYHSSLVIAGTVGIKAVVDLHNVVKEADETNNSQETKLTCGEQGGECCVAGTYEGVRKDVASPTCPKPTSDKFIFILRQANCGSTVEGEVRTVKDGSMTTTHTFKGVVTPVEKCCELKGEIREISTGKTMPIQAKMCKKDGKYYATGNYSNPGGCSGTFTMNQI